MKRYPKAEPLRLSHFSLTGLSAQEVDDLSDACGLDGAALDALLSATREALEQLPVLKARFDDIRPVQRRNEVGQCIRALDDVRSTWEAMSPDTTLLEYLRSQSPQFLGRLSDVDMLHAVFPSLVTMFYFLLKVFRIKLISIVSVLVAIVTFAPLMMHLVAWDTSRIWTFAVVGAFGCVWLFRETTTPNSDHGPSPSLLPLVAVPALLLNILGRFPLLGEHVERLADSWRLIMYAPLLVGVGLLVWIDQRRAKCSARD